MKILCINGINSIIIEDLSPITNSERKTKITIEINQIQDSAG